MISATIGRYKILEEVERGKTGILYQGEDPLLQRTVAIKVLPPTLASDAELKERFIGEAQAVARLANPNIQGVFDIGEHEGIYFIVLELMRGKTLAELLRKNSVFKPHEAMQYLLPLGFALDYAHQYNLIHRNITPGNIRIFQNEPLKITGFGLSWLETEQLLSGGEIPPFLLYLSPEQVRGERSDERSDIFSMGILFYEMLTGKVPFPADSPTNLMQAHLETEPISPSQITKTIPRILSDSILKAIEKKPADRYQTMGEMIAEFTQIVSGETKKSPFSPSNAGTHNALATTYYKQGKMDLAILEWTKSTTLDPYNALTHNNLGTAYEGMGQIQSALREYQKAVRLNLNNFIAHYNLGSAFYRSGDFDSSIAEYKIVIALNSKFASAYLHLGNSYFKKGLLEEAVQEWQKALANNPQLAEAVHNLGNAFWRQGKKEEAVEHWKRALELDAKFSLAAYNIGAALYREGKIEEAKAEWGKALEINPNFQELHYNLGVLAYNEKNYEAAVESWEKALPDHSAYEAGEASARLPMGREPSSTATKALSSWVVLYNLGNAHYQKQNWSLAEEYWRKSLEIKSDFWQTHWNLGNLYGFHLSRPEEAVQEWQSVTFLKRDHWQAYFNIGDIYFQQGKFELAQLEWEKVIALNPQYWPAYHNLGSVAYQRKEITVAVQWWAKALALLIFGWK